MTSPRADRICHLYSRTDANIVSSFSRLSRSRHIRRSRTVTSTQEPLEGLSGTLERCLTIAGLQPVPKGCAQLGSAGQPPPAAATGFPASQARSHSRNDVGSLQPFL